MYKLTVTLRAIKFGTVMENPEHVFSHVVDHRISNGILRIQTDKEVIAFRMKRVEHYRYDHCLNNGEN